jgi:TRAP-type C4-dicarboxylate transport system permease small subunit
MMVLTAVDVTGRYLFSAPVKGSLELSEFMLAVFGMLGMA